MRDDVRICVVGLGYVGLPLAVEFGKTHLKTFGFDVNSKKIKELQEGFDAMGEVSSEELKKTTLHYSDDPSVISEADFIIVAVPTPIDRAKKPDLTLVKGASTMIGAHLKAGSTVVFESTVYPGVTEEICIPLLEEASGLKCGIDWKIGYSPERINPGDKEHTLDKIVKVVSGMDEETLELLTKVYGLVCKAGVYKAPTIKTAEAAKVIENIQRDLNIALVNELSLIFSRMGIHTLDVLEAAGTKWNFHPYRPGLVGGHCIGVDPYYLTYRAEEMGFHPEVILAGRHINDSMANHVADLVIRGLIQANKRVKHAKVLMMGLTFKEDVNDFRNSKVKDIIECLKGYGVEIIGYDPVLNTQDIERVFKVPYVMELPKTGTFDAIVLAVRHRQFLSFSLEDLVQDMTSPPVLIDVKSHFYKEASAHKELIYSCL